MDNLIRSEKLESWNKNYTRWFVVDPNNAFDIRYPGKMKKEWSTSNGAIVWYILKFKA